MNPRICSKSRDGRHNFAITGQDCINGCGVNQSALSGNVKKIVDNSVGSLVSRFQTRKVNHRIHSELHELVNTMIKEFGEPYPVMTLKSGKKVKTFGYYLKQLSKVPTQLIYQWLSEVRHAPDITNKGKVFWWKFKQWKNQATTNDNK